MNKIKTWWFMPDGGQLEQFVRLSDLKKLAEEWRREAGSYIDQDNGWSSIYLGCSDEIDLGKNK